MNHRGHHQHNKHEDHKNMENEVFVQAAYEDGKVQVKLTDEHNQAPELELNHEKELHLIVIREDLSDYLHLHPEEVGAGVYEQAIDLKEGAYKVFVDIQPKNLAYQVKPVKLQVGSLHTHSDTDHSLTPDTKFVKTVNDRTVELSINALKVNHPTVFTYESKNGKPDPYLGALGHVVILDEAGEQFIHVHPSSEEETVFETQFTEPGLYKVWGEFKFGDTVNVYPFMIEVTE